MMEVINIFLVLLAYFIGAIPTSVWVGKRFYNIDIRTQGSKNAGATNTFRILGKKAGIIVLLIDILKGFVTVSSVKWLNSEQDELVSYFIIASSIAAVIGHIYPIYVGFRGGKGVATSLGVILAAYPSAAGICVLIFLMVFISSNYVSLGAICASFVFPILVTFIFHAALPLKIFSWVLATLVIYKHRTNIKRLLSGTESKMHLFKKTQH